MRRRSQYRLKEDEEDQTEDGNELKEEMTGNAGGTGGGGVSPSGETNIDLKRKKKASHCKKASF